jgi:membrane protein
VCPRVRAIARARDCIRHNGEVRSVVASLSSHRRRWTWALADRARNIVVLTSHALWRGVVGVYNSDDLTHAASIAYYALLSLLPFTLLSFSMLGWVTADQQDRAAAVGFVLRYFPTRIDFLTRQLDALRSTGVQIGVLGTLILMWAALGVFSAVSTAVNHAWGVEKQRSYLKHKLVSFVMMLAAGALLLVTLLLMSADQVVGAKWFHTILERFPTLYALQGFGFRYVTLMVLIVAVGLVFYFIPNAKVRFRDVWVGAVLTGLLWRGAFLGFSWYVRDMSRFSVHGSIATVVVFLLWIYISAVILLYGVEFTAAYGRLRRRRPEQIPAAPAPRI